ncbi:zinc-binding metallopeptidase family protein [Actinokineospora bangkokensis]|uniref:Zinc-ribbon domain-containing protein n=1 Tax=Actinokineospora bangkokensis TaxID=1193682 RepID=A0A1Q9LPU3_9PSEU|nr:putative zinc-binding metallopeptidase [Actinokineospora bangkokensis]OLR94003.1 hypothetical protein BJP25_13580 [Actinokineospora bangkokensis]
MRSFSCPECGNVLFFENSSCVVCGTEVGYLRSARAMVRAAARCANAELAGCNWVPAADGELCGCCALTRTRPADSDPAGLATFATAEAAKRRLLHQLDDLGLDSGGVTFDLLSSSESPVTTGHATGVITLDVAEGDDAHREQLRAQLDEPYRTVLGHFRHEIGHYFWEQLVRDDPDAFRELFGDERADYQEALKEHYAGPPPEGWQEDYVSTYATAHPWEDWAETFAHLLHIRDTVQTAAAFGVLVAGTPIAPHPDTPVDALPRDHLPFTELIDTWVPLSRAANQLNRSMGKDDLYPFVLSPAVLTKLSFVDGLVRSGQDREQG